MGYHPSLAWLMAALLAMAPNTMAHTADSGGIYVTTLPSGADIFLDGTYVGRSPALVSGLATGHHNVTLTKTGWVLRQLGVDVSAGSVQLSSTQLMPGARAYAGSAGGTVLLRGSVPGATFFLDGGAAIEPGQAVKLLPGSHRLTVVTPHGRTTRALDVLPDTTTNVVLSQTSDAGTHSAIVAPAEDYLPTDDFKLLGDRVVVHYGGHTVRCKLGSNAVTFDGATRFYDASGEVIAGKLYLPLPLLEKLTGDSAK